MLSGRLVQKELDNGSLVELPLEIPIHRRTIGFALSSFKSGHVLKTFLEFLLLNVLSSIKKLPESQRSQPSEIPGVLIFTFVKLMY